MNKKERAEDIKYLLRELEKTHFDLYRNVDSDVFKSALNKALDSEDNSFKYVIQESLALLKDAHTKIDNLGDNLFPIKYLIIDDDLYIIGINENNKDFINQKVISINGININECMKKVEKLSSHENQEVVLADIAMYLRYNDILTFYGISKTNSIIIKTDKGEFNLVANSNDQRENMIMQNPLDWKNSKTTYFYRGNSTYRFRIQDNNLIFQYNACNNYGYSPDDLQAFQEELITESTKARNIIVDLRQNGGGNTNIMSDTFKNFPDNIPIYVAIGRGTFSSAIHHALYLKKSKNAILIGENAGQKPNRFGDGKDITLPNSKLEIRCSFKYFELLPGQDIDYIKPDISIPVKIDAYINDFDPLDVWVQLGFQY